MIASPGQPAVHPFLASLSDADKIRFALSYPFAQASGSFVYADGQVHSLTAFDVEDWPAARVLGDRDDMDLMDVLGPSHYADLTLPRAPVLAVGSNASPEQLARKYAGTRDVIPTVRVRVADHAIVYAAHVTGYGSIPATLHHCPGATAFAYVNYLTDAQRARMDATETLGKHYAFTVLHTADIRLENDDRVEDVAAYIAIQGVIARNGMAVPLKEIDQRTPKMDPLDQIRVESYLRDHLEPNMPLEDYILAQVRDRAVRVAREEAMQDLSIPTRIKS